MLARQGKQVWSGTRRLGAVASAANVERVGRFIREAASKAFAAAREARVSFDGHGRRVAAAVAVVVLCAGWLSWRAFSQREASRDNTPASASISREQQPAPPAPQASFGLSAAPAPPLAPANEPVAEAGFANHYLPRETAANRQAAWLTGTIEDTVPEPAGNAARFADRSPGRFQ